jgi:hypothetical protein
LMRDPYLDHNGRGKKLDRPTANIQTTIESVVRRFNASSARGLNVGGLELRW